MNETLAHLRPDHEDCECVEELDHGLFDCDCPGYPQPVKKAASDDDER